MNGTWTVRISDNAGGDIGSVTALSIEITTVSPGPTVTINQGGSQNDPTNNNMITFDVVFSAAVTGFNSGEVSFTGSTAPGTLTDTVTGSGTTYTVTVTGMTGPGTVVVSVPAGVAQDGSSNNNVASTSTDNSVTYDNVAPTVTINQGSSQADPTNGASIVFDVVFSESVTGFTSAGVSFTGSTAGGTLSAVVAGSGTTYTVTVSGMTSSGTVVASVNAAAANDAAGNASAASTSTDNSVTYDNVAPTVTINQATGQNDPTNTASIDFDVVFSEPVTSFGTSDIDTSTSTATGSFGISISGSGSTYVVTITGMTGSGTVVATVNNGGANDLAGNPSAASTSTDNSVTFDNVAPSVTIDQASGQNDPTGNSSINFTAVFSEAVTGFTSGDVTITGTAGGTLSAIVTGGPSTYNVAVSGMTSTGTVIVNVNASAASDAAGNASGASTSTDNTVTWDITLSGPAVTINQGGTQLDPTSAAPIVFDVVFAAAVTGFATGDVTLSGTAGGTLVGTVTAVSGTNYTVSVTGMTTSGTVIATIAAGVAQDGSSNPNQASTSTDNTVTWNQPQPDMDVTRGATPVADGAASDPLGNVPFGVAQTVTYTITNSGLATLNLTGGGSLVTVTLGANVTSASVTTPPASSTIAPSGTANFTITYTVTAAAAFDFDVSIANDDPNENPYDWNVDGTGVSAPEMDLTRGVAIADGGTDTVASPVAGTASTLTYTISNNGNTVLNLTVPATAGSFVNCTAAATMQPSTTVAAAASTTYVIQVTPTAAGAFSFNVSMTNDDPNENPYDWTISGVAATGGGSGNKKKGDDGGCSSGENSSWLMLACAIATLGFALRLRRTWA